MVGSRNAPLGRGWVERIGRGSGNAGSVIFKLGCGVRSPSSALQNCDIVSVASFSMKSKYAKQFTCFPVLLLDETPACPAFSTTPFYKVVSSATV